MGSLLAHILRNLIGQVLCLFLFGLSLSKLVEMCSCFELKIPSGMIVSGLGVQTYHFTMPLPIWTHCPSLWMHCPSLWTHRPSLWRYCPSLWTHCPNLCVLRTHFLDPPLETMQPVGSHSFEVRSNRVVSIGYIHSPLASSCATYRIQCNLLWP